MVLLRVGPLADDPIEAAGEFYAQLSGWLALHGASPLTLVFHPADHTHRAWRLAAVQGLARRLAPRRINAVASADEDAILAVDTYLCAAPGITGQYLPLA